MLSEAEFIHLFAQTYESYRGIHPGSDGKGDNWQTWYSRWLLDVSDLPELLGFKPQPDELQKILLELDKQFAVNRTNMPWQEYMGRQLLSVYRDKQSKT